MKGLDPNALFAQARKLKDEMARAQDDLKQRMVEGKAGGGLVTVTANGNQQVEAIRIQPAAVDKDDVSLLEDLVLLAVKDALEKARKLNEDVMGRLSSGMGLPPGMF